MIFRSVKAKRLEAIVRPVLLEALGPISEFMKGDSDSIGIDIPRKKIEITRRGGGLFDIEIS